MAAALLVAGCTHRDGDAPASGPSASATRTSAPTSTPTSGFCLDLTTFQVGVVVFRGDVVDAVRGRALDFEDLKKRAAYIAFMGKQMRDSAPPDIAEQFRTVLDAIATSASRMKAGAKVGDIVDPLYDERNSAAFDAVDKYECR